MKFFISIAMAFVLWAGTFEANAASEDLEVRFGPEFTFTNKDIKAGPEDFTYPSHLAWIGGNFDGGTDRWLFKLIVKMYDHLVIGQPDGIKFKARLNSGTEGHQFLSPNGWVVIVKTDVGVIEANMPPLTVREYKQYKNDIQDALFVSAANVGLFPWDFLGGGHISIDLTEISKDILLFRNLLVDFYNHPELTMGIFGYDTHNALPMQFLPQRGHEEFYKLVRAIDDGQFRSEDGFEILLEKVTSVLNGTQRDSFISQWNKKSRGKNFAINFRFTSQMYTARRLEFRAVRPQKSMDVWVHQIELLQARINYLRRINQPLPIRRDMKFYDLSAETFKLNPPLKPLEALRDFYIYVKEAGLEWKDHRDYIWPDWIQSGALEDFESTEFFREQENLNQQQMERSNNRTPTCPNSLSE